MRGAGIILVMVDVATLPSLSPEQLRELAQQLNTQLASKNTLIAQQTNELSWRQSKIDKLTQELAKASLAAVEQDGAHAIVLGCTGFLGCAEAITQALKAKGHNLPVIDPIPATVCIAAGIVHRTCGGHRRN